MPLDVHVGPGVGRSSLGQLRGSHARRHLSADQRVGGGKSPAGWRPIRIVLSGDGAVIAGCQTLVRRVARLGAVACPTP